MRPYAWGWIGVGCVLLGVTLAADTIVLHDGRRVSGRLLGIRDGIVEVDVQRGLFGRERVRLSQDEIARIDFDNVGSPGQGFDAGRPGGVSGDGRSDPPNGMREREVTVNAAEGWRDTGIMVRAGQTVYFEASGRVRWGPGRTDGPDGERGSPRNESRPMPNRPAAALIGRIGASGDHFFIGASSGALRMRASGELFLGVNDDYLQDNSGSFRVTVHH